MLMAIPLFWPFAEFYGYTSLFKNGRKKRGA
jgi:hypothetical protein